MLTDNRELITNDQYGGLAQLARAPALHAGGPGFESLILHKCSDESQILILVLFLTEEYPKKLG